MMMALGVGAWKNVMLLSLLVLVVLVCVACGVAFVFVLLMCLCCCCMLLVLGSWFSVLELELRRFWVLDFGSSSLWREVGNSNSRVPAKKMEVANVSSTASRRKLKKKEKRETAETKNQEEIPLDSTEEFVINYPYTK
jgi:hypothetical protein